jgi:hypothetical protein
MQKKIIAKTKAETAMKPLICIDKIDFKKSVHTKSIEKTTRLFHGTWGYLHLVRPELLEKVDPANVFLESYTEAIKASAKHSVPPSTFFPSTKQSNHFWDVVKSQIATAFFRYIAKIKDPKAIPQTPPPIDPIEPHVPDITMLKMMIASDNSAEGMGKVLQGINNQTNESPAEFSERLQVMEGDLGTYCNLESIRALRKPTAYAEESLSDKFMLLGASHTLWNVAQAVFLLHHDDSSNSKDLGAWHTMESLGIPSERPITKKDFTLMISNMQRVHEVTIVYCLL